MFLYQFFLIIPGLLGRTDICVAVLRLLQRVHARYLNFLLLFLPVLLEVSLLLLFRGRILCRLYFPALSGFLHLRLLLLFVLCKEAMCEPSLASLLTNLHWLRDTIGEHILLVQPPVEMGRFCKRHPGDVFLPVVLDL